MLSRLTISNYALIDTLDLEPGSSLSIITGETGAGKSIMLGALGLLKGERADSKVIADKGRKSVVEAIFSDVASATADKVRTMDPEWDGRELILRREILPSGRSRAFVNDSPVAATALGEVARQLLDIHSQNSNSLLSEEKMQLDLVDSVSGCHALLTDYEKDFRRYVEIRQQIKRHKEESVRNREQSEIIRFKLAQLEKLKPKEGELGKIESRYEALSNSEEIRDKLTTARNLLMADERGVVENLEEASANLADINFAVWGEDSEIEERLQQCIIEIKDISETLESMIGEVEYDPSTLSALSARMQAYYTAFKTFNVEDDAALVALYDTVRRQNDTLEGGDGDTETLEKEARELALRLKHLAAKISQKRKEAARLLRGEIEGEARKLGLDNLKFEIDITPVKLSRTGGDRVEFKAAFNKNQTPMAVGRIASGGEMARLMLAIKKKMSERLELPTVIFDEIDTGVSGYIADRMGEMMREMGEKMQILTITHLPQVAAKGQRHFKVYKEDRDDRTVSDVTLLSEGEREEEIARMLAGERVDEAALVNARSLLNRKQKKQ